MLQGERILLQLTDTVRRESVHLPLSIDPALYMLTCTIDLTALGKNLQMLTYFLIILKNIFGRNVIEKLGKKFLKSPLEQDTRRVLRVSAARKLFFLAT